MVRISGTGNSLAANYAAQLVRTSRIWRNLNTLDTSIQNGDLPGANAAMTALVKENPQFTKPSSGSNRQDSVNQGFTNLSAAITASQPEAVKSAWDQIKSELAKSGIVINDGSENTKKLLKEAKQELDEVILNSPETGTDTSTIDAESADSVNALLANWVAYKTPASSPSLPLEPVSTDTQAADTVKTTIAPSNPQAPMTGGLDVQA